ncbi:MAG: carbonic anhydrase [Gammaproteobacteria bacterium]|nr:carbonic anhydrase [Gammaproteobacteria bacterium]
MHQLEEGIKRFHSTVFPAQKNVFEALSTGQHPKVLMITCADSRVVPHLFTSSDPGNIFMLRNVGNIVPVYEAVDDDAPAISGEAGGIQYAVKALGITDIIVCGHSHCGAVNTRLKPDSAKGLSDVLMWVQRHIPKPEVLLAHESKALKGDAEQAVLANVLAQREHLETYPAVQDKLDVGEIRLHAWMYQFETGSVFAYNDEAEDFELLSDKEAPSCSYQARPLVNYQFMLQALVAGEFLGFILLVLGDITFNPEVAIMGLTLALACGFGEAYVSLAETSLTY